MEVFILFVTYCVSNAHTLAPMECALAQSVSRTEGVFQSNGECNARGDFLTKNRPRPKDYRPEETMYYCEPWKLTLTGSPLDTGPSADVFSHVPRRP